MLFGMEDEELTSSQWSYPRYQALRDETGSLEQMAGYGSRTMTLTDLGDPALLSVEVATPSLFPLLGVTTARGRVFGPEEEDDGSADMVALVSHSFWETRMGRSEDVVGSMITMDQLRFQVLGVVSETYGGMGGVSDVWIPMSALREVEDPSMLEDPWSQHFHVVGRLGLDVGMGQARSEVRTFGETVMDRFPPPAAGTRLRSSADVLSFPEARRNPAATTSMLALFAAVLLLLLIAAANLAALFLARSTARLKETAVRASLGAARSRLFRQLLTESVIIALVGGLLGVGLAWMGMDVLGVWLTDMLGTEGGRGLQFVDTDALSLNWRVLAFAITLTGGVGIAFGLLPAWQVSGTDPGDLLKGSRSVTGLHARTKGLGGRSALIAAQVALALLLLSAASLMLRTMANLQRADLGFDSANLLTAMYTLSPGDEQAGIDLATFHVEFVDRLRALPGVRGATLGEVPMGGPTLRTIVLESEGLPSLKPEDHFWVRVQPVTDNHLGVLGASLLDGRDIERTDDRDTEKVVVLSRMTADELFPDGNALGRRIQLGWPERSGIALTVVGITDEIQFEEPGALRERLVFVPLRQSPQLESGILVRTVGDPEDQIPAVRSLLRELAPNVALTSAMSMERRAWETASRSRVLTALLGFFGTVALLLVAVGLYGTIAYTVARRTRELGLRASLGAGRASLVVLVLRRSLGVTLVGIGLGIVGSIWTTRFLEGLLVDVGALDPTSLVAAASVLFLVALVATYLPARRGARIDPMSSLRTE